MDHYVTLGANDAAAAQSFYDAALATIGWSSHAAFPGWRAYSKGGAGTGLTLWICTPFDGGAATSGNGTMLGFAAASPAQVDAFYAAAMAHGGTDEGAAGPRPHYGPDWYAAYVRDPSGNKLAIVHNG
ncbi:MAG: VOC family protein [Sphingomonas adhaesiva]|uniref:VOC family protein n=1 Tax=Sphingomonas adhaesiva TaxID=28212 RepID=UPI002FFD4906